MDRAGVNELLSLLRSSYAAVPDDRDGDARQYEALGSLQVWQRYPEMVRWLAEQLGTDGLASVGSQSLRQLGSKANRGHLWGMIAGLGLGRGIAMGLGRISGQDREEDLTSALDAVTCLYQGLGQAPFVRENPPRPDWVDTVRGQVTEPPAALAEQSKQFDRLARLLNFHNRRGTHVSGPYPVDGGLLVVRDYFLSDDLHHWADLAAGLPHVISRVLLFAENTPLPVAENGQLPPAIPARPVGAALFVRDAWDSADARPVTDEAEVEELMRRCSAAADLLAARVASMPRRDRVMAGAQAYYADLIAPLARAGGVWEKLREEFDFFELDPLVSEAYYDLIPGGGADDLVPRLINSGAAFAPIQDPISAEDAMPALHILALRGSEWELPVPPAALESAGLVGAGTDGYQLTEAGRAVHERLLNQERMSYEAERLEQAYERFLEMDGRFGEVTAAWDGADDAQRDELLAELADIIQRARVALRRTNEQLVRFEPYLPRMRRALVRAQEGEDGYVVGTDVDSVRRVWLECLRDYRLTQGLPLD
jgi:hypothetical protein